MSTLLQDCELHLNYYKLEILFYEKYLHNNDLD